MAIITTRYPIAQHRRVSARPCTLLVYEGNKSHVIKNMAATVKFVYGVALNDTVQFVPCDQISLPLYCTVSRYRTACLWMYKNHIYGWKY